MRWDATRRGSLAVETRLYVGWCSFRVYADKASPHSVMFVFYFLSYYQVVQRLKSFVNYSFLLGCYTARASSPAVQRKSL